MKIGIVLYPTFGGSGVVATELGKALAKKGHEIHFITYSLPVRLDRLRENIYFHEVSVSDYPLFEHTPYEQVLTSKLVDVVKYEKLDLLHCHYAIPHASVAYMAQQILQTQGIVIPFITTLHGTDITLVGKDPSFEPVITFSINRSTKVTAVSESLRRDTFRHFDITREIDVIPNFICSLDYQLDNDDKYKCRYAPNGELLITHVSNFRKVKRVADVLAVFKGLLDKGVKARLMLVGDGPERNKLERQCREWGVCSEVVFLGSLKSTTEVLTISDLFILPSETESFGLAALEALASGVPVIASNTGGIPEVVEHGVSGYLSNVGDVDDMIANASKILESKESLKKFKLAAKKQAMKFDKSVVLPLYERLYEEAVAEARVIG
ncbi:N-acetyl-alpha-D-glucosaminyl L-malate synthase BshA [Parvicella tangerina]|uniref:N-acetyl-alpha-D-glucosaminyl L-malate synthase n=1 Tax=Parvicella tangerina TaxID=2829795 RepID=A0A916JLJ9_9FLAO|nr:N-acetyl-alpha-D-glucosaminyl L-malate synthase BshA [Parvicella tangerina]CAG5080059.1 N-acetyl-alpha-D-glucosaminyl L-malate synthase [Parvicella tangerina]